MADRGTGPDDSICPEPSALVRVNEAREEEDFATEDMYDLLQRRHLQQDRERTESNTGPEEQ